MARHFFASGKGLLSNEEESLEVSTGGDDGSQEALATLQAEGEAMDAEADAAADEAKVADGLEGVVALEEMRLTLRAANENGGMNSFGAAVVNQHANFILQKFLKSGTGLVMPSNESFGGAGSRVGSGVMTMESIKDKAGEIWKAIVNFLKKMKDKVMAWVNKIFGAAEKLGQRADAIKARADKNPAIDKTKSIENDTLFAALAMKDAVETAKLKTGMASIVKLTDAMITESTACNEAVVKAMEIMEAITPENAKAELAKVSLAGMVPSSPAVADGEELPGNVKLRIPTVVDQGGAAERFEGYGLPSNGAKTKTGTKMPSLDLDEIKSICTMVKTISESLVATRKIGPASEKAYKRLDEFAKKQMAESDLAKSDDGADKSGHGAIVKKFKLYSTGVDGPVKALAGYVLKTSRASLDYCDASLSNSK